MGVCAPGACSRVSPVGWNTSIRAPRHLLQRFCSGSWVQRLPQRVREASGSHESLADLIRHTSLWRERDEEGIRALEEVSLAPD